MALTGDLGMDRVPAADRDAHVAMVAELKASQRGMQKLTRKGRAPILISSVLAS